MKPSHYTLAVAAFLAAMAFGSGNALAEEYVYRDLMANTLPSSKCLAKPEAVAHAQDSYLLNKKEKVFCETQGYGWNLQEEKNVGKLVCEECGGNNGSSGYQCHLEDIVVACKRIKPGSVGMFPGKG
ncbi:MAG: hypothetical protein ACKN9T_04850 [Candidatus Methylumidiphilus sp.]